MFVSYLALQERYISRVRLDSHALIIEARHMEGLSPAGYPLALRAARARIARCIS